MSWDCSPTCIGSLAFTDPSKAVDIILEKLSSIPFWPQLPVRGPEENMYVQFSMHLPGARIDKEKGKISIDLSNYDPESFYMNVISDDVCNFSLPRDNFSGFYEIMARNMPENAVALKGQITGPISLGLQITDATNKPVIYDESYSEIIRKELNMMARWQEHEMQKKCHNTIMFVDEPYLSMIGTPFASISVQDAIRYVNEATAGLEGTKAVHCCANTDWSMVMAMDIDVVSFDAYEYGHAIGLYPEEVSRFLEKDGALAWGIVPNNEEKLVTETPATLVKKLEDQINVLEGKGISKELLLKNAMITPQCGLSGISEQSNLAAIDMVNDVSDLMRIRHSLR